MQDLMCGAQGRPHTFATYHPSSMRCICVNINNIGALTVAMLHEAQSRAQSSCELTAAITATITQLSNAARAGEDTLAALFG